MSFGRAYKTKTVRRTSRNYFEDGSLTNLVTEKKKIEESKSKVIGSGLRERESVLITCDRGFVPFYSAAQHV